VGVRFSEPVQTGPGAHPASCTMGTGSFPEVKRGRDVMLTPHPLLVLWSRKGRAIPLLSLQAIWPVQSLSACTRVYFTFLQHTEGTRIALFIQKLHYRQQRMQLNYRPQQEGLLLLSIIEHHCQILRLHSVGDR